jgi:hypothetical protein
MKRMNVYIPRQMILVSTLLLMLSCNSKAPKQWGIEKDSCLVRIMNKPPAKAVGNEQSPAFDNKGGDTMVDFIVSFQTKKTLSKPSAASQQIFGMDGTFGLMMDTTLLMPVFCQPIATGDSKKYTYWVSFEADKKVFAQANKQMIIQPNPIVKDSIHYKLL